MLYVIRSLSLFSEQVTEIRTQDGQLIGWIETLSSEEYRATNYLKLVYESRTYQGAEDFITRSWQKSRYMMRHNPQQGSLF